MRVERRDPPREFQVGPVTISHCADVELEPDEQITLVSGSGTEYDIVRKSWGYYATPSTNRRLAEHGLRAALTANADGRIAAAAGRARPRGRLRGLPERAADARRRLAGR